MKEFGKKHFSQLKIESVALKRPFQAIFPLDGGARQSCEERVAHYYRLLLNLFTLDWDTAGIQMVNSIKSHNKERIVSRHSPLVTIKEGMFGFPVGFVLLFHNVGDGRKGKMPSVWLDKPWIYTVRNTWPLPVMQLRASDWLKLCLNCRIWLFCFIFSL